MPETTVDDSLRLGLQHHESGRLNEAETVYREVLARQPANPQALYLLGTLSGQSGRWAEAESLLQQAIAIQPGQAIFYNNLGIVLKGQGKIEQAIAAYRCALECHRDYPEALNNLGNLLASAGQVDEAESACRAAIKLRPNYAEAWYNLGIALYLKDRHEDAIAAFRKAIEFRPLLGEAWYRMGLAVRALGKDDEAIECFTQALRLRPLIAEAHLELGVMKDARGLTTEAIASYRQALALRPNFAEALNNLATALKADGQLGDAIHAYRQALAANPKFIEARYNLGNALALQGKLDEAIATYREVLAQKPDYAAVHNNLGVLLKELGRLDEAATHLREVLRLEPHATAAMNNLGVVLFSKQEFAEAADVYLRVLQRDPAHVEALANLSAALNMLRQTGPAIDAANRALKLKPDHAGAHNNLGFSLKDDGALDEAIHEYRESMRLKPDYKVHSNLLYIMHYHPGFDSAQIFEEHRRWNKNYALPLGKNIAPHTNTPQKERRIRIGYVSPDFRSHPTSRFMIGPLGAHNKDNVEIVLYSDVIRPDDITAKIQAIGHEWRNIVGLSDDQVAQQIRDDKIDIFVDLTMHMTGNRLLVLARKPAPVQVSYLAYPSTSGLTAIDYRLTDRYFDPIPEAGTSAPKIYSEENRWLPETFWCYGLLGTEAQVNELPALTNGHITFGCLNNFCKVNEPVVKAWARVLQAVPNSRMIILCGEGAPRERTAAIFEAGGVSRSRLEFVAPLPPGEYFKLYHRIDLALDTWPYNGHTTSLDGVWMGVPVVTRVGRTTPSRGGLSMLFNLGMPELVAWNDDEFVKFACELARDTERLREIRKTLRERLRGSPLMNAPRFVAGMEAAYRAMWEQWCVTR